MSLLRNLVKSVTLRAGCAAQSTANLSRKLDLCQNQTRRKQGIETQSGKLQKDNLRYVIKDKTDWGTPLINPVPKYYSRNIMENRYVLNRANIEKKKCFEQMESVQKQWRPIKRFHNIMPQTTYDPGQPNLWMKVKDMYATSNYFVHPDSLYKTV